MEFNSIEEMEEYFKNHPGEVLKAVEETEIEHICPNCKEKIIINFPLEGTELICKNCGVTIQLDITSE